MPDRYFITIGDGPEREVGKRDWIKCERDAGFRPKCASTDSRYWTECATGGFSSGSFGRGWVSGRIEIDREERKLDHRRDFLADMRNRVASLLAERNHTAWQDEKAALPDLTELIDQGMTSEQIAAFLGKVTAAISPRS